jgi:hypothetical protein
MDQDAWAKNSVYRSIDPRRALQTLTAIRRANLELLGRLSASQRRRWGAHSQFGRLTHHRQSPPGSWPATTSTISKQASRSALS